jgi:hypothetical protein
MMSIISPLYLYMYHSPLVRQLARRFGGCIRDTATAEARSVDFSDRFAESESAAQP